MNEFKDSTFCAIESRIHAARLERSAVLGDALGQVWLVARRLLTTVAGHTTELKARTNASQHLPTRQHLTTLTFPNRLLLHALMAWIQPLDLGLRGFFSYRQPLAAVLANKIQNTSAGVAFRAILPEEARRYCLC